MGRGGSFSGRSGGGRSRSSFSSRRSSSNRSSFSRSSSRSSSSRSYRPSGMSFGGSFGGSYGGFGSPFGRPDRMYRNGSRLTQSLLNMYLAAGIADRVKRLTSDGQYEIRNKSAYTTYKEKEKEALSEASSKVSTIVQVAFIAIIATIMIFWFAGMYPVAKKLDSSKVKAVSSQELIIDNLGWLTEDVGDKGIDEVEDALDYFYKKTGVQPMVVLSDGLDGISGVTGSNVESQMKSLYASKFNDDGHLIFYMDSENGADSYDNIYIYAGYAADSVIDNYAQNVIYDTFDYYFFDTAVDEYELVAKTFTSSANKIMNNTGNILRMIAYGCLGITVVIVLVAVGKVVKSKKELDEAVAEANEEARRKAVEAEYESYTGGSSSKSSDNVGDYLEDKYN